MALTSANRAKFIGSCIDFLKKYPFIDGLDLDWEYPSVNRPKDPNDDYDKGCPGGPEDKENYNLLLKEIREALNSNGMTSKLLTATGAAGYDKVDGLNEPDVYMKYLDFLNIMTYDFHGAFDKITNHQAALFANPADPSSTSPVDIKTTYNTDYAFRFYRDKYKISPSKLNIGSPYYSRGWAQVNGNPPIATLPGLFVNGPKAAVGNWDNP